MFMAECPNCESMVNLGTKPKLGDTIRCKHCATQLEIVWLDPPELDWPWDFYEEDDEDLRKKEVLYDDSDPYDNYDDGDDW